jgi:hypothetical protein
MDRSGSEELLQSIDDDHPPLGLTLSPPSAHTHTHTHVPVERSDPLGNGVLLEDTHSPVGVPRYVCVCLTVVNHFQHALHVAWQGVRVGHIQAAWGEAKPLLVMASNC